MSRTLLLSVIVLLVSIPSVAQLDDLMKSAESAIQPSTPDTSNLSNGKITAGLTQALQVGIGRAVASTGKPDGFLKNEAIKIMLPEKLETIARGMRMIGMGAPVDELEVGMNRAAEQAAPKAKAVFLSALRKMTFDDARKILTGNDTAATDYFKRTSSADLTTAFSPIVHQSMENVGVVKKYEDLKQSSPSISALAGSFDLDKYVVGKTLDGIFYMLGQEEQKIRKNPVAQTTQLLKAGLRAQVITVPTQRRQELVATHTLCYNSPTCRPTKDRSASSVPPALLSFCIGPGSWWLSTKSTAAAKAIPLSPSTSWSIWRSF